MRLLLILVFLTQTMNALAEEGFFKSAALVSDYSYGSQNHSLNIGIRAKTDFGYEFQLNFLGVDYFWQGYGDDRELAVSFATETGIASSFVILSAGFIGYFIAEADREDDNKEADSKTISSYFKVLMALAAIPPLLINSRHSYNFCSFKTNNLNHVDLSVYVWSKFRSFNFGFPDMSMKGFRSDNYTPEIGLSYLYKMPRGSADDRSWLGLSFSTGYTFHFGNDYMADNTFESIWFNIRLGLEWHFSPKQDD